MQNKYVCLYMCVCVGFVYFTQLKNLERNYNTNVDLKIYFKLNTILLFNSGMR